MPLASSAFIIYVILIVALEAFYCEAKRRKTFREPAKYCGPRLTQQLHDFCELFYGPTDLDHDDRMNRRVVADECCDSPCSILYIVLSYCKKPKDDVIRKTFGNAEIELYESIRRNITHTTLETIKENKLALGTLEALPGEPTEKNVRRKKHIRRHRKKKKRCKCQKDPEQVQKENILMTRTVPEYIIGLVDYYENEPVIIAN